MKTSQTPSIEKFKECRACRKTNLEKILTLPNSPFTDDFINKTQIGKEFLYDIDIYICKDCKTVQTQHNVDVGDYCEDYQYSVGASTTASDFMKILAENLKTIYYANKDGKKVLEIGSGDGQQLLAFKNTGCEVLGYEPSSVLCDVASKKGIASIQGLFTADSVKLLPSEFKEVDIIMLSYTFDHLPDPRGFINTCGKILNKKEGLLVVEIHDLQKIVERKEYCLFEHEHSIYLTQQTAINLCRSEGFEIVNFNLVQEKDRRANSLIFVATPSASVFAKNAVNSETPKSYNDIEFYKNLAEEIYNGIDKLDQYVAKAKNSNKTIAGYGGGGRGVMTLSAMKNASILKFLVDKKPKGDNLFVPKSAIPLVDLEYLRLNPVDEIIVFSFGYFNEIKVDLQKIGYKDDQLHSFIDIIKG